MDIGTQPRDETPVDFRVEIVKKKTVINIELVRLSLREWPKGGPG